MTFAPSFFRLAVDSFRVAGVIVSFFWYSGGYSVGDPPLPIPNREVKPSGADGTAFPRGRVGSRRSLTGARPGFDSRAGLF